MYELLGENAAYLFGGMVIGYVVAQVCLIVFMGTMIYLNR